MGIESRNYESLDDEDLNIRNPGANGYSPVSLSSEPQSIQQPQPPQPPQLPQQYPPNPYYVQYNPYPVQPQQQSQQPQQPQPQQQMQSQQPHQPQMQPQYYYPQPQVQHSVYVQEYPSIPNVIVKTSQNQDEEDFNPALIFFVAGFCFWCVWFVNIKYLKSRNKNAKLLATLSVIFGVLYLILILVVIVPLAISSSNHRYYYN
ncbi:expressed protein [Dictyostelium purpureum]|uniref:Expressed protein n=1 Tax=Dictyostelium purpureum TaxID=5786 RepID=F0ZAP1_DICPU|nr:uncharacterized protein DICPUDRAFT_96717 [Dictyostelium purpureum]EGC39008.1 expressed protein [Dictyostelium purpureum]|eukprot:XP_003284461.1 expressed protein [Dictyostelium purpureum]